MCQILKLLEEKKNRVVIDIINRLNSTDLRQIEKKTYNNYQGEDNHSGRRLNTLQLDM